MGSADEWDGIEGEAARQRGDAEQPQYEHERLTLAPGISCEQARPWLGHACLLTERPPELHGGTREVRDAVSDHEVEAAASRGNALHRSASYVVERAF